MLLEKVYGIAPHSSCKENLEIKWNTTKKEIVFVSLTLAKA